jgi:hypothetical protein
MIKTNDITQIKKQFDLARHGWAATLTASSAVKSGAACGRIYCAVGLNNA